MEVGPQDLQKVHELLLEVYRVRTPYRQIRAILGVANQLAPSFISSVTRFNAGSRKLEVVTRPWVPIPAFALKKMAELAHESPFPAYFAASGDPGWRTLDEFMPIEDFQKTRLYKAMFSPIQCSQIISTVLATFEHDQISLTLCRRSPAYSPQERALLNLLTPHLALSFKNAEIFDRVRQTGQELQAVVEAAPRGYAYFSAAGQVAWTTKRARELWQRFYPAEPTDKFGMPQTVLSWSQQQIARLADGHQVIAEQCLSIADYSSRLEMRISPSPLQGMVLTLDVINATQPRFLPLADLSSRQNETLQWMVEGKRNSEIARILNISERTVEKHVAEILERLQAENRATAIVRAMENCAAANLPSTSFDATI